MSTPKQEVVTQSTEIAEQNVTPLQPVPVPDGVSPIVAMVASGQYTPEILKQMLEVQKDHEQNEARKAYAAALSEFRKLAPTINKDRAVSFGNTNYQHASLGNTMDTVNPILGQCGLNLSWDTKQDAETITVTAILTHQMGHSETVALFAPPDSSGQKNTIQQIKSTITYLQRTTGFAILGLAESFDDDGHTAYSQAPPVDMIDDTDMLDFQAVCEEVDKDFTRWVKWIASKYPGSTEELLAMPKDDKAKAIAQLKKAAK